MAVCLIPNGHPRKLYLMNNVLEVTDSTLFITSYSTRSSFYSLKDTLPIAIDPRGDIQLTIRVVFL